MSTLTASRSQTMPRVNLLPPEIGQERRFRKVQVALGAAVAASAVLAGAVYLSAVGQVGEAQNQLDSAQAAGTQLDSQAAKYANVPVVYAAVDTAEASLTQAMSQEVRWSFFLNDLSHTIPKNVWLTKMTMVQNVDGQAPSGASVDPSAGAGIGSITFEGKAFKHNDVAAWLDSLAKQNGYADPYFSSSAKSESGTTTADDTAAFQSSVIVTDKALSQRYTQKAGN